MSQIKNLILDHPHYRHNPATREAYRHALSIERKVRAWQRKKRREEDERLTQASN